MNTYNPTAQSVCATAHLGIQYLFFKRQKLRLEMLEMRKCLGKVVWVLLLVSLPIPS